MWEHAASLKPGLLLCLPSSWEPGSRPHYALGGSVISRLHSLAAQHPWGGGAVMQRKHEVILHTDKGLATPPPRRPLDAPAN